MKKRQVMALAMAMVMALGLTACGGDDSKSEDTAKTDDSKNEDSGEKDSGEDGDGIKIGWLQKNQSNQRRRRSGAGAG